MVSRNEPERLEFARSRVSFVDVVEKSQPSTPSPIEIVPAWMKDVVGNQSAPTLEKKHLMPGGKRAAAESMDAVLYSDGGILETEREQDNDLLPPTDVTIQADNVARKFVDRTIGNAPDTDVYMIAGHTSKLDAFVTPAFGRVAIRNFESDGRQGMRQRLTPNLVHERAHTTGLATLKIIDLRTTIKLDDEKMLVNNNVQYGIGMHVIRLVRTGNGNYLSIRVNEFLEEAFAEETAARYRSSLLTEEQNEEIHEINTDHGVILVPRPYVMMAGTDRSCIYSTALPAHAVRLMSECTGVDIYDLIILSRDPAYEAEAKRKIIQAINSIETGLYRKIRNTPYTLSDFLEMYTEVKAAIDRKTGV